MSDKKYYAVKIGRNPGIYETWDECSREVTGFSGAKYKSFKTREEALDFISDSKNNIKNVNPYKVGKKPNHLSSAPSHHVKNSSYIKSKNNNGKFYTFNGIGAYFNNYSDALTLKHEKYKEVLGYPVMLPSSAEAKALAEGEFSDYLKENLLIPDYDDYDAVCFSDGSFSDDFSSYFGRYKASFGLIIIPRDGQPILESGFLESLSTTETKRIIFDENGEKKLEDIIITAKSHDGYVRSGMAETAECEGAVRVLEICSEKGYSHIKLIVDADNIKNAIKYFKAKQNAESLPISRLANTFAKNPISVDSPYKDEKVRSHTEYEVRNPLFFYAAMNDLSDIMAKAELKAKSGANIRKDNPNIIRLIPNENGIFDCNPERNGLSDCIKDIPNEKRRKITRDVLKNLLASELFKKMR